MYKHCDVHKEKSITFAWYGLPYLVYEFYIQI